ncbi:trypsin-like peptidase domain-containing protein [Microbacterium sp. cx-59]|uniref:trypsin-like peptidase domain-containing protein n=1 Tax=Microbacterium sp. cx-59 TaxID=2891207 RepID=UPI001E50BD88|nr:trypsin-like peptidase domain-containing protein [Microbacterium sp. cx-59]MCC4906902.1 trypsin-like peptidase domain-containing protein [Microbacterium sp. cx-59]
MSDTEGERPESVDAAADSSAQNASPTAPAAGTDVPASTPAAAQPPVPPRPEAPVAPQSVASPSGAAQPVPPRPPYPAAFPAPTPKGPQQYAGQTPGQAGQSFGPAAQTGPTLPIADSTPAAPAARKKSTAGRTVGLLLAAAIVGGAAGLGGTYAGTSLWGGTTESAASSPSVVTVNDTTNVNAVTGVAAKVVPSVVTISATSTSGAGTGSGVILSDDGYVLTNTHVVTLDGQTSNPTLSVSTSDGKVYSATVVGTDPTYDLAVIKLTDASGLTPIEFADSSNLNVGDNAIAIGAPLGLDNTVTTGIVSALNRSIEIASSAAPDDASEGDSGQGDSNENGQSESPFQFDFGQGQGQTTQSSTTIKISVIQTDAAINPGNSGGALVDDEGKLIGINVAIASSGGTSSGQSGNIGVGFSIPSNIAERVANEIIDSGSATHGLLGATVQDAASMRGATIEGASISEVSPDGAAAAAGLQSGDIVTRVGDVPIGDAIDLTAQVRAAAGGSDITLTYVRDGETRTADVTLGTLQ